MITKEDVSNNEEKYYKYFDWIEKLRQSGVTNMYGAVPYIQNHFLISSEEATVLLAYWMNHYNDLLKKRGWKR